MNIVRSDYMSKKRIYEYAKELNLKSKEIIDELKSMNVEVSNHMQALEDDQIKALDKKFKKEQNNDNKQNTQDNHQKSNSKQNQNNKGKQQNKNNQQQKGNQQSNQNKKNGQNNKGKQQNKNNKKQ
ncbi:translation initiation factor IF-2 [Staphylococcus caprae M23864:W1]|nr:translation initiation factor IF-2 [Staphylococcus caprae M23864:W1]